MRLRREDGFTVVELAVGALLASVLLALGGALLVSTYESGAFTEGQVYTLNSARTAMLQIEKEIRGADSIDWCAPTGSCLTVGAQTPTGQFRTLRYKHSDTEVTREIYDDQTSTWSAPETVLERVANDAPRPVFSCDTQSTLLRVTIDLHIEPTPQSDPSFNVTTTVRPRNFPERADCP